jgi:hypothetical protein
MVTKSEMDRTSGRNQDLSNGWTRNNLHMDLLDVVCLGPTSGRTGTPLPKYAQHPDVQERLYQSMHIDKKDLNARMDFLSAVLQEVLRMYPPVGVITRCSP